MRVKAIRGATVVNENSKSAIISSTQELLKEIILENSLQAEQMISIIFTATDDLTAEFPAVAAREIGLAGVPLLCSRELSIEGSMRMCIRILMHVYFEGDVKHIYLGEAKKLRDDIADNC